MMASLTFKALSSLTYPPSVIMSSFVIFWLTPPLPLRWWRHLWTTPYWCSSILRSSEIYRGGEQLTLHQKFGGGGFWMRRGSRVEWHLLWLQDGGLRIFKRRWKGWKMEERESRCRSTFSVEPGQLLHWKVCKDGCEGRCLVLLHTCATFQTQQTMPGILWNNPSQAFTYHSSSSPSISKEGSSRAKYQLCLLLANF